jgi:hypothetical protein
VVTAPRFSVRTLMRGSLEPRGGRG